jgi:glucose-1-phosphate adenylyltransferase
MAHDLAKDTVAVVLAGGKRTRLGALTRKICKPALPFGAGYRNIDFSLSNCVNSGVHRIGVVTQHEADVLHGHLETVWRRRATGPTHVVETWPAEDRAPIWGYRGTADAVFRNLEAIQRLGCHRVLVLAGDHVYKMDYRTVLEHHCRHRADATVGCVEVAVQDAHQFGILSVNEAGRIERFVEKPQTPDELPSAESCVLASRRSVLFSDVIVGVGADVAASVVLPGAVIGRGCRVRGVVVDSGCRIPAGMVVDGTWSRDLEAAVEPIVLTANDFAETSSVNRDGRLLAGGGR